HNHEVCEFARFDRANVAIEPEILRAVNGRTANRLERRQSALLQHPEFPMSAETLKLSVRAEVCFTAQPYVIPDRFGKLEVIEVIFRDHQAASRARIDARARRETQE